MEDRRALLFTSMEYDSVVKLWQQIRVTHRTYSKCRFLKKIWINLNLMDLNGFDGFNLMGHGSEHLYFK